MLRGSFDRSRSITSLVLFLDADDAPLGPDQPHADGRAFDHVVDVGAEHFLVFVQQRLALGGVDEDGVGLAGELDVGGKAGPAGPDHARLENVLNRDVSHGALYLEEERSLLS